MRMKTIIKPFHETNGCELKIPQSLYQRINHANGSNEMHFTFGKRSVPIQFQSGGDRLEINKQLASELLIPFEDHPIHMNYDVQNKELKLGPVIALLTAENCHRPHGEPFGAAGSFFKEMARYCIQKGFFFYVVPLQAPHNDEPLFGCRWVKDRWVKENLPYPNAIYNRITSRKLEKSEEAKALFNAFQKHHVPIFNERFLNKWEVYNALQCEPVLIPHLPKTILYRQASDLDSMLQNHAVIFAKPITGSLGKGIIKITHSNGNYTVQYSHQSLAQHREYRLLPLLRATMPALKRQPYLIQQGIEPLTFNGQPTDFRILLNKNQTGVWQVTSIVARRSANERIVSNVAMGGSLHRPEQLLSAWFTKHEQKAISKLLVELSLQCVKTIEQHCQGTFGEFGIDLLIDEHGKPWILEVNTKPSKTEDATAITMNRSIRPSTKALIHYAAFLSGFEFD